VLGSDHLRLDRELTAQDDQRILAFFRGSGNMTSASVERLSRKELAGEVAALLGRTAAPPPG
jgi:hypothetical protein